ncbi:OmpW/AlkL family protein [Sphingomonas sp. TX0543]|uniref:OmpW/AlkL family protein n=1 Tax=unclassified Sphingomonas TaxID=196159 RepID=UPI0010F46A52|nr:OmpW family outer membrane protein [Sphingomonas sp. 3P27F8]
MKGMIGAALVAGMLLAAPAMAQDRQGIAAGDVLVRLRAITVMPNEKSSGITPAFPNERVAVGNAVMPEIDLTYMATDHIGFELIASTTKHNVSGTGGATGAIGKLASSWVLPPTLTAQYHFDPKGAVRPYVGAGINYSIFWNSSASDELQAAVGTTKVRMSDSFGWAAQVGVDVDISRKMFVNLDVKYIDMHTNARLDTTAIGRQSVHADINPLVFGAGVGVRF